jgi:hypothetical protein
VKPVGNAMTTLAPVAASGPRFCAFTVNTTLPSVEAGVGLAAMLVVRSAPATTWVSTEALSLFGRGSGVPTACTLALLVNTPVLAYALARNVKLLVAPEPRSPNA